MATGDLKNNLRKLHSQLKVVNYCSDLDIEGLSIGKPSAFLPILHYVFADFSLELAQYLYSKDYELLGKSDMKFINVIYRILRDEFHIKATLTKDQFFTLGFAERKLQLVTSIVHVCRKKGEELRPKRRKTITGKITKNKLSVCEKNNENISQFDKPISMDTSSKKIQQKSDSDPKTCPVLPSIPSNGVIQDGYFEEPSDCIPRKMPIAYNVAGQMSKSCWSSIGHGENPMAICVSPKDNISMNNCLVERNIPSTSLNENVVEKVDIYDRPTHLMPRVQPKKTSNILYEGKTISSNQKNGLAGNDLATCLDRLTTKQDSLMIFQYFKAQQSCIEKLENNAAQSDIQLQELVKRNSQLSARVMVLETAVTLLQEQIN